MENRQSKLLTNVDWPLVLLYFLMVALGWMNVYAAVYSPDNVINIFSWDINSGKQLAWIGTSLVLITVILVIDHKVWDSLAYFFYFGMILLLLATLIIADPVKGSRSWLVMGPVRLQPAEFAKFATALAVSKFMSSVNLRQQNWQEHAKLAAMTVLPPNWSTPKAMVAGVTSAHWWKMASIGNPRSR